MLETSDWDGLSLKLVKNLKSRQNSLSCEGDAMRSVALASCLILFGCGGDAVEDDGGGAADAGQVVVDSGAETLDAGSVEVDAGSTPVEDAGNQPADAGEVAPADAAQPPPRDAGPNPAPADAGQGGGGGGSSCIQAMECALQCAGDEACNAQCLAGVAPQHRQVTQAMFDCAERNNCVDPNCMMQSCGAEAEACGRAGDNGGGGNPPVGSDGGMPPNPGGDGGAPPNPGGGEASCSEFLRCAMGCDLNDQQCNMNCMNSVRPASMNVLNSLMMCMQNRRCQDWDCARTSCPDQMQSCMADR